MDSPQILFSNIIFKEFENFLTLHYYIIAIIELKISVLLKETKIFLNKFFLLKSHQPFNCYYFIIHFIKYELLH
jgi:hypothetical protein